MVFIGEPSVEKLESSSDSMLDTSGGASTGSCKLSGVIAILR